MERSAGDRESMAGAGDGPGSVQENGHRRRNSGGSSQESVSWRRSSETTSLLPPPRGNDAVEGITNIHYINEGDHRENGDPSPFAPPIATPPHLASDAVSKKQVETEQDYKPLEEDKTSDLQCLMHILKGNIGTGVLAMPVAVSHAGLWFGLVGILFLGLAAVHCMHLLVKTSKILAKRSIGSDKLSYADVMAISLSTGPSKFRRLAPHSRYVVNALLLFTQYGFCCVYIVFIATNIKQVVDISYPNSLNLRVYELVVAGLLMMYCTLKDLRTLAPFSTLANIFTLAGMILIFLNISQDLPDVSTRPAVANFAEMPLFFGQAIFSFEGISLVLPLEASMKERERFGGLAGVLNLGMVTVTALYVAVGFFGYLKFGPEVAGSITLNLPNTHWYYVIVKPMFSIAIFVSYNVQLYVCILILMPWLCRKLKRETDLQKEHAEIGLRAASVVLTLLFAMAIPHLDLLIALIGAVASASLALVLPALIHLLTMCSEPHPPSTLPLIIIKDLAIAILGFIGFTTGTYSAIRDIVKAF